LMNFSAELITIYAGWFRVHLIIRASIFTSYYFKIWFEHFINAA